VLADALVAAGDPRGEFIQLQMAHAPTEAMVRRANELLTEHGKQWMAGLGGHAEYRGGFVYRLVCTTRNLDSTQPEWATIEELEIPGAMDIWPVVAKLKLLRVLVGHTFHYEKYLGDRGPFPSIRTLGVGQWLPKDRRAFPNLAVISGRWLTYHDVDRLHAAQRASVALGLDAIVHHCMPHVPGQIREIARARAIGPAETRFRVLSGGDERLVHAGWSVRLWRDRDVAMVGFTNSQWFDTTTARHIIAPLAEQGIRRIELAIPPVLRARSAKELAAVFDELSGVEIGEAPPFDVLAPATVVG